MLTACACSAIYASPSCPGSTRVSSVLRPPSLFSLHPRLLSNIRLPPDLFQPPHKTKTARTQALEVALERLNKVQLENDAYLQTLALSLPSRPSLAYALDRSKTPTPPPAPPPNPIGLHGWDEHNPEALALAGLVASAAARGGGVDGDAGLLLGLQAVRPFSTLPISSSPPTL
jgi:hypothetical protein